LQSVRAEGSEMMGTMRALLERLTGRYRFIFKPVKVRDTGVGPDKKLVAQPTKVVSVELEHYAETDRWSATIFDGDAEEEFSPDYIVGGHNFAKGLTQAEAEEAAIEVTLKYLSAKGRPVREAIDTDFSDPAAKLDDIERRMLQALVGRWMDAGQLARAVKAHPARVDVRLDNLLELEYVERKVTGHRTLYTVAQG
jgi:hypothetical protein